LISIVRFHYGHLKYRPEIHHLLFEINTLLALMGEILQHFALGPSIWTKEIAERVMKDAETYFESSGLRSLLEAKREELSSLQVRLREDKMRAPVNVTTESGARSLELEGVGAN
jgi:hypothetical protein